MNKNELFVKHHWTSSLILLIVAVAVVSFGVVVQDTNWFEEKGVVKGEATVNSEILNENRRVREFAERTAVNTPIQGSAADLIKVAMINIHDQIKKQNLNVKMILQVHDELVFEVLKDDVEYVSEFVRQEMEKAIELSVPIKVDIGTGKNWLEAH